MSRDQGYFLTSAMVLVFGIIWNFGFLRPNSSKTQASEPLPVIPMTLGEFQGHDVQTWAADEVRKRVAGAGFVISRNYVDVSGQEIFLDVIKGPGYSGKDPVFCYRLLGWTVLSREAIRLQSGAYLIGAIRTILSPPDGSSAKYAMIYWWLRNGEVIGNPVTMRLYQLWDLMRGESSSITNFVVWCKFSSYAGDVSPQVFTPIEKLVGSFGVASLIVPSTR